MNKPVVVIAFVLVTVWAIVATLGWSQNTPGKDVALQTMKIMWRQDAVMGQIRSDRDQAISQSETAVALADGWKAVALDCDKALHKKGGKYGPR